jgi:hypothetical protein
MNANTMAPKSMEQRKKIIPSWDMPSDPVKAVFWFINWSLKVLVRFFWILILVGVTYESLTNNVVGGIVTLLIGLGLWLGLGVVLFFFNLLAGISRTVTRVGRMQQGFAQPQRDAFKFAEPEDDEKIVEGTVTDLEEERRKRRRE